MGGGMEANKNKYIEEWGAVRENLEHNFRWTRRNLALVGIFGIALPVFVYKGIVKEFHMQDEDAGRPYRKFIVGHWILTFHHDHPTSQRDSGHEEDAISHTETPLLTDSADDEEDAISKEALACCAIKAVHV